MKKILILLSSVLLALGLFWAGAMYVQEQNAIKPYAFQLESVDGPVRLSDFKGKMPIVYFGYMYCPDICPTTLALSASALRGLSKEDAQKFQLIFISVDPQRDSLKDLKEYAQYFYPDAIGLSGDEITLKEVTGHYGTYYAKETIKNSSIDYTIAHTTNLYFFDKKGKLSHILKHPQDPDEITQVLNEML